MEFHAPPNHTIDDVPVSVVATPSNPNGYFVIGNPGSDVRVAEIGFSKVNDSDVHSVRLRDFRAMRKYMKRASGSFALGAYGGCNEFLCFDGSPVAATKGGAMAVYRVVEKAG